MKIYVAGPMRGKLLFNWPAFYAAAKELRDKGHDVVNPAEIDEDLGVVDVERSDSGRIFNVRLTDKYDLEMILGRDLEEVVACDGIVMLDGWHLSEGARKEHEAAVCADLKVFYSITQVPAAEDKVSNRPYNLGVEQPNWWALADSDDRVFQMVEDFVSHETRVVDPETGGMKNKKPCQLSTAPPLGLEEFGKVCGWPHEAGKYPRNNYRKGYAWSLSLDAAYRHILRFQDGEDIDPETGLHHLAHAAWHCLALIQFGQDHPEKDDRWAS